MQRWSATRLEIRSSKNSTVVEVQGKILNRNQPPNQVSIIVLKAKCRFKPKQNAAFPSPKIDIYFGNGFSSMENFYSWIYIFIVNSIVISSKHFVQGSITHEQLVENVFRNYNKFIRPVRYFGEATNVSFYMTLLQLISVTEKTEQMTTSVYLTLRWNDSRLMWNPEKFGGISQIRVPSDAIWKPEIALHNNNDGKYDTTVPVNALLNFTGVVEWLPAAFYKSSCQIKVDLFPFDWQNCTMKFKSFAYNKNEVAIESAYSKVVVDKEAYRGNGEWNIVHCPIKTNDDPADPSYQDITVYFIIERRPLFYIINILVPCILISSLSVLVFLLPSASSEKMTMGISVLLGLTVYLLLLAKRVPETSLGVPLVGSYLLFTMVSVTISIAFSVIVLNCYHQCFSTLPIPRCCHLLFMEFFPRLLRMKQPECGRRKLMENFDERIKKLDSIRAQASHRQSAEFIDSDFPANMRGNHNWEQAIQDIVDRPAIRQFGSFSFQECCTDVTVTSPMKDRASLKNRSLVINQATPKKKRKSIISHSNRSSSSWDSLSSHLRNEAKTTETLLSQNATIPLINQHSRSSSFSRRCPSPAKVIGSENHLKSSVALTDSEEKLKRNAPNNLQTSNLYLIVPQTDRSSPAQTLSNDIKSSSKFRNVSTTKIDKFQKTVGNIANNCTKSSRLQVPIIEVQLADAAKNTKLSPDSDVDLDAAECDPSSLKQLKKFQFSNKIFKTRKKSKSKTLEFSQSSKKEISAKSTQSLEEPISRANTPPPEGQQRSDDLTIACTAVNYLSERMRHADQIRVRTEDWHFIANVLDRLLLIIFFCIFLMGIIGFTLKAMLNPRPDNPFEDGDPKYAYCLSS